MMTSITNEESQEGWVEIHSHFLPGIDDGCKNSWASIRVLQAMGKQGIVAATATPHYYPEESISEFLKRRETSYKHLMQRIEEVEADDDGPLEIPEIYLGAEVAYREGISRDPMLKELCYNSGESSYLLLEMPFHRWSPNVLRDVEIMCCSGGITPVIAHMERYDHYQTKEILDELYDMDILVQMNAEYLLDPWTFLKARSKLRKGLVQVIGSDCHNMVKRPPNLGDAISLLNRKGMTEEAEDLRENGMRILFG